jgi:hypothetical protein
MTRQTSFLVSAAPSFLTTASIMTQLKKTRILYCFKAMMEAGTEAPLESQMKHPKTDTLKVTCFGLDFIRCEYHIGPWWNTLEAFA